MSNIALRDAQACAGADKDNAGGAAPDNATPIPWRSRRRASCPLRRLCRVPAARMERGQPIGHVPNGRQGPPSGCPGNDTATEPGTPRPARGSCPACNLNHGPSTVAAGMARGFGGARAGPLRRSNKFDRSIGHAPKYSRTSYVCSTNLRSHAGRRGRYRVREA